MHPLPLLLLALFSPAAVASPTGFPTAGPIRFLALGDTGTGSEKQYAVAKAMEQVCKERGCQFAVLAGDNLYEDGPKSASDPQFETKFEKPYASLKFPFFMALGNHDVRTPKGDEYEIEYSKKSSRWMMPSRFYRFAAPVSNADDYQSSQANPIVELFVIDTNGKTVLEQGPWLRKSMSESSAHWKIVVGHHPYRSNGYHGNAGSYDGVAGHGAELQQLYEKEVCDKADLSLTGHSHDLEWLNARESCGPRPQFIVSGAAAKEGEANPHKAALNSAIWEAFHTLGFFWMEATQEKLRIVAYTIDKDGKPKLAHEGEISKARTPKAGTQ